MKRLVVTADDFGLTDGVCQGILEAMSRGVVSCTSAMVAFPGAAERVVRHDCADLAGRLGLHLQLTSGRSCAHPADVPTLVGENGRFPRSTGALGVLRKGEVETEFRAQARRLQELGLVASHLDSHHHVHHRPDALGAFVGVAESLGIVARGGPPPVGETLEASGVRHADALETGWFGGTLTVDRLLEIVDRAFAALGGAGTVELMCHPGRSDATLEAISSYTGARDEELSVLCAPELGRRLEDRGIAIVPHGAI